MDAFFGLRSGRLVSCWLIVGVLLTLMPVTEAAIAGDKYAAMINCDVQKGSCELPLGDRAVTLEVLPRPVTAMESLTFKVGIDGVIADLAPPHIRLNMPAMDMGKNKVVLKLNGQGVYEGQGVIVRCRSGRRTWKATVDFPDLGAVDFIFDVVYKK